MQINVVNDRKPGGLHTETAKHEHREVCFIVSTQLSTPGVLPAHEHSGAAEKKRFGVPPLATR
jgi:hypothetical protein